MYQRLNTASTSFNVLQYLDRVGAQYLLKNYYVPVVSLEVTIIKIGDVHFLCGPLGFAVTSIMLCSIPIQD